MLLQLFLFGLALIGAEAHEEPKDYFAPAKYTYSYGVEDFKTGDYKTHKEERVGDVVKGEYRVADPDGSIRTVTYTADDKHGFQAVVKKSGSHQDDSLEDQKIGATKVGEELRSIPQGHDNGDRGYSPVHFVPKPESPLEPQALDQYQGSPKFRILNVKSSELTKQAAAQAQDSATGSLQQNHFDHQPPVSHQQLGQDSSKGAVDGAKLPQNVVYQALPQLYENVAQDSAEKNALDYQTVLYKPNQIAYYQNVAQAASKVANAKTNVDVKAQDQQSQISYYNEASLKPNFEQVYYAPQTQLGNSQAQYDDLSKHQFYYPSQIGQNSETKAPQVAASQSITPSVNQQSDYSSGSANQAQFTYQNVMNGKGSLSYSPENAYLSQSESQGKLMDQQFAYVPQQFLAQEGVEKIQEATNNQQTASSYQSVSNGKASSIYSPENIYQQGGNKLYYVPQQFKPEDVAGQEKIQAQVVNNNQQTASSYQNVFNGKGSSTYSPENVYEQGGNKAQPLHYVPQQFTAQVVAGQEKIPAQEVTNTQQIASSYQHVFNGHEAATYSPENVHQQVAIKGQQANQQSYYVPQQFQAQEEKIVAHNDAAHASSYQSAVNGKGSSTYSPENVYQQDQQFIYIPQQIEAQDVASNQQTASAYPSVLDGKASLAYSPENVYRQQQFEAQAVSGKGQSQSTQQLLYIPQQFQAPGNNNANQLNIADFLKGVTFPGTYQPTKAAGAIKDIYANEDFAQIYFQPEPQQQFSAPQPNAVDAKSSAPVKADAQFAAKN